MCNAILTGRGFLASTLANVDCQARAVGAYGYGALSDPGSSVSLALTSLLTIFIALFAIKLLLGSQLTTSSLVTDALRIGIVLALASSWPAWRVVGYDLVFNGPSDVAGAIGLASGLPGSQRDMVQRLQDADNGIVAMTIYGSGRLTGGVAAGTDLGDSPAGIAVSDQLAFGVARTLFLSTSIGSFALVRIGAGILLALTPLMAGLLLFAGTIGLFVGWIRALVFCALANTALLIVQGTILSMLYPWIGAVLAQRKGGIFALSAPTELLVLCLAYATLTVGVVFLLSRLTFFSTLQTVTHWMPLLAPMRDSNRSTSPSAVATLSTNIVASRAQTVAGAVRDTMQREDRLMQRTTGGAALASGVSGSTSAQPITTGGPATPAARAGLGSSFRRGYRRTSSAAQRRDLAP